MTILNLLKQIVRHERGATAGEYAVLLALVAVALAAAVAVWVGALEGAISTAGNIIGGN